MRRMVKLTALIIALALLFSGFAGCKRPGGDTVPQTVTFATNSPAPTIDITAEPVPEFVENPLAANAFDALDLEVFQWYVTDNGYNFHMSLANPAAYDIDPASVPMTLGEFTEEDSARFEREAAAYLARLDAINREELPEKKQFTYDVLRQILASYSIDTAQFAYMYEPLTENSGIHASLPILFALFELESAQDVEDYLSLLADTPRYLEQVLDYEKKRAKLGYFMTADALEAILAACQTIIDARDTFFLYATFNESVDGIAGLTAEQAKAYKERNASLVRNEFIGAYKSLHAGLKALKRHCRSYAAAARLTKAQKAYFEYSMQDAGCNQLSVEETLELLKTELFYLLDELSDLQREQPDLPYRDVAPTSGDTQTDLDLLKTIAERLLPAVPEHTLTLSDVPEELEDMTSPAFYVIPALDEWKKNTVYINLAAESPTPILTLAHEAYPGHLYQYVYQRGLDNVGLMQQAVSFGGCAEGWAQFAEHLIVEHQQQYDRDYLRFHFARGMVFDAILPAIFSIQVNYYGYTVEALETYFTILGYDGSVLAPIYYNLVIDQPYYFFEYAVGYSQLIQLYRDVETDLGESFEPKAFLKTYLDLGPGYFDLLRERMDIWADGLLSDAI